MKIEPHSIIRISILRRSIIYFISATPFQRNINELAGEYGLENGAGTMLSDEPPSSLTAYYGLESSPVPDIEESFDATIGFKDRVNRACKPLSRVSPNDNIKGAICHLLFGYIDRKLESIISKQGSLVTKLPPTGNPSRMLVKKLDMSLLKFPVRRIKKPRITLNEAIYLVHETCPRVMKTGVERVIKACNEAFHLVKKWSALHASKQRQIGQ